MIFCSILSPKESLFDILSLLELSFFHLPIFVSPFSLSMSFSLLIIPFTHDSIRIDAFSMSIDHPIFILSFEHHSIWIFTDSISMFLPISPASLIDNFIGVCTISSSRLSFSINHDSFIDLSCLQNLFSLAMLEAIIPLSLIPIPILVLQNPESMAHALDIFSLVLVSIFINIQSNSIHKSILE